MGDMITAAFNDGEEYKMVSGLWQWDYGQILRIQGLNLPTAVEVDFAVAGASESVARIGTTKDGVTDVVIPDSLIETGKNLVAYVYLRDSESGNTEYQIDMVMSKRAKPEAYDTPEDKELFGQAIEAVNTAADRAEKAGQTAQEAATKTGQDAEQTAQDRIEVEKMVNSVASIDEQVKKVEQLSQQAQESVTQAGALATAAEQAKAQAETAKAGAETAAGKTAEDRAAVNQARTAVEEVQRAVKADRTAVEEVKQSVEQLGNAIPEATQAGLQAVNQAKRTAVDEITRTGTTHKKAVEDAGTTSVQSINNFKDDALQAVETAKTEAVQAVQSEGTTQTGNVTAEGAKQVKAVQQTAQEIAADREQIRKNKADIGDLRAYIGYYGENVVGVQVDYKNKSFKRIAGAVNLTKGADFDRFSMFGGRRRCNVADNGTIVAWHGDPDYKEDGSMGQVMVYQPKFYYLVCPVVYDPIETGIGYHLRKANYYVSSKPRAGFRLHPAFYDENGNEIDYILMGAFEGSVYDTSAQAYLLQDEQVADFTASTGDKFSSIAGARPATGVSQNLTRPNIEQLSKNRGAGWHLENAKIASMNQLLMMIEYGQMELQKPIGQGIVTLPWTTGSDTTSSYAGVTGSTSALGNKTGRAERTTTYEGGVPKEYTVDDKTSVTYRGLENPWGNIWKLVYGVNIWGNGKMDGGQPYICKDFNYSESKNTDNYIGAGFTVTNKGGYISAMAYSPTCDWLFMASECLGNSSLPVGDYNWVTENLNGYRIALLGGFWNGGGSAGAFDWTLINGVGGRNRHIGGRLVYIPTRDSAEYTAAIALWKEQMEKGLK